MTFSLESSCLRKLITPPDSSVDKGTACMAGDHGLIPGLGRSAGEGIVYPLQYSWASLVAQLVKNLPAMQETRVWSLGWEDLLEKEKATRSSILAWRIPWTIQSHAAMKLKDACSLEEKLWSTFSSVQFSHSDVSTSLWLHEPQHTRPPCPSPNPGAYPNPCPLSQWCHPTISFSVVPFSFFF